MNFHAFLMHWWPHAKSLHPIPPGLCNVGDIALLRLRQHQALLRVLVFKPGKRLVLAVGLAQGLVLLDMTVAPHAPNCQLHFQLETPADGPLLRRLRQ